MWFYSAPQLYELLVMRLGWPLERYGEFVADAMIAALLPRAARPADPGPGESGAPGAARRDGQQGVGGADG